MNHLFFEILILSGVATIIVRLCTRMNLPSMLGFIFTGLIIGPSGFGVVQNLLDANAIIELVGVLLMFTIGLEFNRSKLSNLRREFFKLGPLQVFATTFVTTVSLMFFTQLSWQQCITWGMMLSLSSTAQVLKILHDGRDTHSRHAQNSLGILLFQDIAVIPMLLLLPLLANVGQSDLNFTTAIGSLSSALLIVIVTWFVGRYILPRALRVLLGGPSQDLPFFAFLFVLLSVTAAFHSAGISASLGAFIAGFLIAETEFGHQATSVFLIIRDTLLGIFFASIGAMVEPKFVLQNANMLIFIFFAVIFLKAFMLWGICRFQKSTFGTATITAILLSQIGEFSFVMAARAKELGLLSELSLQYFLTLTVSSMVATPILYKFAPTIANFSHAATWWKIFSRQPNQNTSDNDLGSTRNHDSQNLIMPESAATQPTIVIGYGIAGKYVCNSLTAIGLPVNIIDANHEHLKKHHLQITKMFFGDATDKDVLLRAGIMNARLVVIAVSSDSTVPRILGKIRAIRPDIKVIVRTQFLLDAQKIELDENVHLVVAELETTIKLVSNCLKFHGVDEVSRFRIETDVRNQSNV